MDTINLPNPVEVINKLEVKPDVVELHGTVSKKLAREIKEATGGGLVAVAGEIEVTRAKGIIDAGADILMVSEVVTCSKNINKTASAYLQEMGIYEVDQFRVMTDF